LKNSLVLASLARSLNGLLQNNIAMFLMMFIAAFFLMLIVGLPMIGWLKNLRGMKWSAREDTPDTHLQKHGTPSMGGIGIIGSAVFAFVSILVFVYVSVHYMGYASVFNMGPNMWVNYAEVYLATLLLPWLVVSHAILGLIDDRSKATGQGGLRARSKLVGQCALAATFLWVLTQGAIDTFISLNVTRSDNPAIAYGGFALLVILLVGVCNAVNITDGIDGLAAGLCVQIGLAFALILMVKVRSAIVIEFWAALAGACFGFLFFNRYPAKVFMGDTGSLALGAAVGGAAVLSHAVFLLPFIGFIFFVELFSVTAQVLYFKYTRKTRGEGVRLLRRAPLHHHFELGGWSEWRVVGVFWIVNLMTSVLGLILWHMKILPRFP